MNCANVNKRALEQRFSGSKWKMSKETYDKRVPVPIKKLLTPVFKRLN